MDVLYIRFRIIARGHLHNSKRPQAFLQISCCNICNFICSYNIHYNLGDSFRLEWSHDSTSSRQPCYIWWWCYHIERFIPNLDFSHIHVHQNQSNLVCLVDIYRCFLSLRKNIWLPKLNTKTSLTKSKSSIGSHLNKIQIKEIRQSSGSKSRLLCYLFR